MKPSERRKQMKNDMADRLQESYNSKDSSGKFKSIFLKDKIGNVQKWKASEDEHFLNIIPFIAGNNMPIVDGKKLAAGKVAHCLDVWVHGKVGINEDSYICLARSYGGKCPICEEQAELRKQDDYDDKYVKSLNPSRRVVYNIECLDSDKEAKKGLQYFEVSHYLFEKELTEIAKKPRGGGFITYQDPDDGKIVFFRKSGSGPTNTKYSAFKFEDRTEIVSDDILDAALVLDECIHIPSYEEVKNAFYGTESEVDPEALEERKTESESTRRQSAPPKFKCPGDRPTDFGDLEACDDCPDVDACEKELEAKEEADLAAKTAQEEKAEVKETPSATRRVRSSASEEASVEKETVAESTTDQTEGRRLRRRPGA
jgi:hypothetical protein